MTSSIECTAETMFPWFYLTQDSEITCMVWYIFGNRTLPAGKWDWLEHWDRSVVEAGVKDGPACFYDLGKSPGLLGFKLLFVEDPEAITC